MTATCWLITSGYYSDYQVHAVCPTKEAAEAILAADEEARHGYERREPLEIEEVPFLDGTAPLVVYKGWTASGYVTAQGFGEPHLTAEDEERDEYQSSDLSPRLGHAMERFVYVTGRDPDRVRKAWFDMATVAQASLAGF